MIKVRAYEKSDTVALMQLFHDTVHGVNSRDYTKAQVDAWAPANQNVDLWMRHLSSQFTYVAEQDHQILGFGQLAENGYIDRFYCHQHVQRRGIGTQILEQIEIKARSLGIQRLFTEASITAKPFFASKGFTVVRQQSVERRGQVFTNFLMEKFLN
ncbi:MAG: GNAT family N-acetyltransferase [Leptolyngbyaceae bacterium]|nr:GNAT family N-acetyltransferase [Leptolyngbyaceae bacterium]